MSEKSVICCNVSVHDLLVGDLITCYSASPNKRYRDLVVAPPGETEINEWRGDVVRRLRVIAFDFDDMTGLDPEVGGEVPGISINVDTRLTVIRLVK